VGSLALAGARVGAPAAVGARFALATCSNSPLARLPGRPRPLGFVGRAANAFVVSFGAIGLGMLLASAAHLPNCSLKRTAADGLR